MSPGTSARYGPSGFVATLAVVLVIGFITWILLPWIYLAVFVIPPLLVVIAVAGYLVAGGGRGQQIGRGMLIGCLTVPAALVVFLPLLFLL